MKKLKRGRPTLQAQLQKQEILQAALAILDADGPQGLSMRTLAKRLKVTPMALYHHVEDRSALLRDISDWVYAGVACPSRKAANPRQNIEALLTSYREAVLRHPGLTLSIFADPNAFSFEAERITKDLAKQLASAQVTGEKSDICLDLLVDFTHGSSIATAMTSIGSAQSAAWLQEQNARFLKGLRIILEAALDKTD